MTSKESRTGWLRSISIWQSLPDRDGFARIGILAIACLLCAGIAVDYTGIPTENLEAGEVAPRTVKAPIDFHYQDDFELNRRREAAAQESRQVYVHNRSLAGELRLLVHTAFEQARVDAGVNAREQLNQEMAGVRKPGPDSNEVDDSRAIFEKALSVHIPKAEIDTLRRHGFPPEAEILTSELIERAMENMIIVSRDALPANRDPIVIQTLPEGDRDLAVMTAYERIITPSEARQQVSLSALESNVQPTDIVNSAATLARALLRPNLSFDAVQTQERRDHSVASVSSYVETVKKGATLFRGGDTLTSGDIVMYEALLSHNDDQHLILKIGSVALFLCLFLGSLYQFGARYLTGLSTRIRDVAAGAAILVLTAVFTKFAVASSAGVAELVAHESYAASVWFIAPVAGSAMLVRLLLGSAWTVVFSLAAAVLCGLMMDFEALFVVYFLLSSFAGAGAVEHSEERKSVLAAGLHTGIINGAFVLLIHLLEFFMQGGNPALMASNVQPIWSMSFGFIGGILSAFLVLALVPAFETLGFITGYRLQELAHLNHPLLRKLMLRAPGSYHHSMIVGTLSEAACGAIGAEALSAKVAAYFHDIGKAENPQYFIENQERGTNRHESLTPLESAEIIIQHVRDGAKMAIQHRLPKSIVDNIYMHHGTGLLQYFYVEAVEGAADPDLVNQDDFRYPGPKPNSREAGVIMLADKIEAATRTLRNPTEREIRLLINRIINSVMADGQFSECPLTFREIHDIANTFVTVLLGIYHQRIEYPEMKKISTPRAKGRQEPSPRVSSGGVGAVVSAAPGEIANEEGDGLGPRLPTEDYESVDYLPHGEKS